MKLNTIFLGIMMSFSSLLTTDSSSSVPFWGWGETSCETTITVHSDEGLVCNTRLCTRTEYALWLPIGYEVISIDGECW